MAGTVTGRTAGGAERVGLAAGPVWRYREDVWRVARGLCRHQQDAEDVTQNTLLKAADRAPFRVPGASVPVHVDGRHPGDLVREVLVMTQLIVRDPGQVMAGFDRDLDELFALAFGGWPGGMRPVAAKTRWTPACDVFTRGEDLVVRMELPGIDPDTDVRVTVDDGVLCVRGERTLDRGNDQGAEHRGYYRRELASGTFERAVALPDGVRPEDITAHYANGILDIVMPHAVAGKPVRVPIDAGPADDDIADQDADQDVKEVTAGTPQA